MPHRLLSLLRAGLLSAALLAFAPAALADEGEAGHAHEHQHDEHGVSETIVVTASPLEHDRDEVAVPVDRIDREELLLNLGSTLGETVNQVPGISSTGFTAGASRPVVRGQDAFRTEVLEDGLRTQDVSRESPDHAVPVNALVAERVEIVRGPGVLRYGGSASAGVVNVITNRVPDGGGEDGISADLYGGIGLVANQRDLAASIDGNHGNFAFHADGLFRTSNDYSIPNDRSEVQSGTETDAWMGSLGGTYSNEIGRFGASYTRIENEYGLPEEDEPVMIDMHADRFRFEGDLFAPIEGVKEVRVRGVYTDYEHDEIADGSIGQTYRNEEFDGRVEVLHEEIAGFTGAIGFHGQHRDFRGEGEAAEFLSPAERRSVALYFFEERVLTDKLNLELGYRYENTRVQGVDAGDVNRDLDFDAFSGSVGLVKTPTDWLTLGANGSISQRAPAIVELLARGAHEATATFEIGDEDLDIETSFTGDFRIEAANDRGRIQWAGFVTHYEDYIFAARTGNFVDEDGTPGGDLAELLYTNRDALFYGFEVAGDLDVFSWEDRGTFTLDAQFDYVRARFDGNGANNGSNNVPRITPIRWGGGVSFRSEDTSARVGFLRHEAQDETGDFETNTKNFTYLNASLTHTVVIADEMPLDLSIIATNLTDVRGRNAIAFNKDDVILPGRNIRFGVRARF
ncbi:MAG: TonB-dependent receptor [Myxococcota bacterium]